MVQPQKLDVIHIEHESLETSKDGELQEKVNTDEKLFPFKITKEDSNKNIPTKEKSFREENGDKRCQKKQLTSSNIFIRNYFLINFS